MKLIVGLGNPGRKYQGTRHNIGFAAVEGIASRNDAAFNERICGCLVGRAVLADQRVLLAKPQGFMNRSGAAVRELLREARGAPEDLVIIYDELDLPFGRIRVRAQGSAGGHRGVSSIIESLAGASFYRVRVGIGRPPPGVEPADFVLQSFSSAETELLPEIVARAGRAAESIVSEGGPRAMQLFNAPQ